MSLDEFKISMQSASPDRNWHLALQALWYDCKGQWEDAHNIAQDDHSNDGSWIHAYLHRKEGDDANASYWYHRAGKKTPKCSLHEEWEQLVGNFLA